MVISVPRRTVIALSLLAALLVPVLAAGCSKDETPPPSTGYYTGPMKRRGAPPNAAVGEAAAPNAAPAAKGTQ